MDFGPIRAAATRSRSRSSSRAARPLLCLCALVAGLATCDRAGDGAARYRLELGDHVPEWVCTPGVSIRRDAFENVDSVGLNLPPGGGCNLRLDLPPETTLSFGVALSGAPSSRAVLAVTRQGGGGRTVLLDEPVSGAPDPIRHEVALPSGPVWLTLRHPVRGGEPIPARAELHWGELVLASPHPPPGDGSDWAAPLAEALAPYLATLPPPEARASRQRLLIVGIDGAAWETLEPLLDEGALPTLADLRGRGRWGVLRSSMVPESAQAWSMAQTGVGAGRHGVFTLQSRDTAFPPYWERLGQHGLFSIVVALPKVSLDRPLRGALIGGWTAGERWAFARPPQLLAALQRARYRPRLVTDRNVARMLDRTRSRAELAARLLERAPWDHAFVVFEYSDTVGHRFGLFSPEWASVQREIDAGLARILSVVDRDTVLLVMSDHGWRRYRCAVDVDRWLAENQLGGWRTSLPASANVIGIGRSREPPAAGGPHPAASPTELREVLARLRDPETLEPLIARVVPSAEAFEGPRRVDSPARFLVEAREDCHLLYHEGQAAAVMHREVDHHSADGIYLLVGPGIESGRGPEASLRDIAPTVLSFYGLTAGEGLRGEPLLAPRSPVDVRRATTEPLAPDSDRPPDAPDAGGVDPEFEETLRALGYLR